MTNGSRYTKNGDNCLEVNAALGTGDANLDYMTGLTELDRLPVGRI